MIMSCYEPIVPPFIAPTVIRAEYFYPRQDAETLKRAMKGLGTDEKTIISVLTERSNEQRILIAEEYKKLYEKELIKSLKGELGGDFRDLVISCVTPMYEYIAREIQFALVSNPVNHDVLTEIICTHCNSWLKEIAAAYQKIFNKPLESAIRASTLPGLLPKLYGLLCRAERIEDPHVDEDIVAADAQALCSATNLDSENSKLTIILTVKSIPHIKRVFAEYEKISGQPFDEVIKREFKGIEEKAMLAIVYALRNSAEYLASRFYSSMAGLGTNERTLNRLILVRCELDLEDIKQAFVRKYGKSLASFVEGHHQQMRKENPFLWCTIFYRIWLCPCPFTCNRLQGDTSADYKRMLLAILK